MNKKDLEDALKMLEEDPSVDNCIIVANWYSLDHKEKQARQYYEIALEKQLERVMQNDIDYFHEYMELGFIYGHLDRKEDEQRTFNRVLEYLQQQSDSTENRVKIGQTYSFLHDMQKAIDCFEEVILEDNKNIKALEGLMSIYSDQISRFKNFIKAKEIARRILEIEPDNQMAKFTLEQEDLKLDSDMFSEISGANSWGERIVIGDETENYADVVKYVKFHHWIGIISFILGVVMIFVTVFAPLIPEIVFHNNDNQIEKLSELPSDSQELGVNQLSDYDGYSKSEIYGLRKRYVSRSMFNTDSYEPNEEVFGRIQDGKYWYGTENLICYDGTKSPLLRAEGDSYDSRLINNPSFLIGLDLPYVWNIPDADKYKVCRNKKMLFIPKSISYSPKLNMITSIIEINKNVISNNRRYMLNGMNAKDLGFKYGYVFNKTNIRFEDEVSAIDKKLYEFLDYLSVGSSCGISGGCNNLCPMQANLMFFFGDERYHEFYGNQAVIDFKLWKEKPASLMSKPDMYYRLIFER